ncbi:MAG: tetratricopeptide repeat protein [Gemmatimonadetes bacterium]|nr:tetratricopeptide repeat protein [Gemmatimonadota bacterium]
MILDKSFITRILRGRPYLAVTAVLTIAAVAMTQMPLVDDLGFEFAFLTAFIATFAVGLMTIHLVAGWRSDRGQHPHGQPTRMQPTRMQPTRLSAMLVLLFGLSLSTLLLPMAVMFVKSWISGFCNVPEGLAFYLLLPGISVLWSTAVALVCVLAVERRLRASLLFLGVMFVSIGISLYRLATQPPVFVYNPIIGYFPGPIYDEVVVITTTLLTARAIVLVSVLAMAAGLYLCFDPSTWKLRPARLLAFRGGNPDGGRAASTGSATPGESATLPQTPTPAASGMAMRVLFLACLAVLAVAYVYRAPLGIVIDRQHIQQTLGGHRQTAHFDIYYDLNTISAWNIDLIARDHEYQLARVTDYLDVRPPSTRIASYIYAHADQKKRLMGARHTSMERPGADEMHLNNASFPHPVLKHELVHVVSAAFGNALYGGSYWIGFHEGLAEAVDWQDAPMNPHEWSRAMRELGLAPPLENLLSMTGFWTAASSRSYTLCGSFVRFLIERHGLSAFKKAFPEGAVEEAYGRTTAELIAEWETFVDGIQLREDQLRIARQRFIRPAIFRRHCPHEVAALNDRAWQAYNARRYSEAVRDFDRVLELAPENPSALRGLLYGTYRLADYERTESAALLIERPDQTVGLLADAHLVRGDTAWKTGRIDDARRSYEAVVDLQASDDMSRGASIRMEVLDREPIRDTIMAYLTAVSGHWRLVLSVRDTGDLAPDYGAGYYLLGRWLFLSGSYEQALKYLSKADALGLPGELVRQESLRLEAMAYFYLERYEQSAETFGRLAALAGSGGVARTWEAWIDRCRWYRETESEASSVEADAEVPDR